MNPHINPLTADYLKLVIGFSIKAFSAYIWQNPAKVIYISFNLKLNMEKSLLSKLSKELEIPQRKILDESINVFSEKELRDASAEILKIKM